MDTDIVAAPDVIPDEIVADCQRRELDQRCACTLCDKGDSKTTLAVRASCTRCHEPLRILHWSTQAPLAYGTCPNCRAHVDFDLVCFSATDMAAFETAAA